MQIYLPIAEMSVDVFLLLGLGAAVGFLSGLFGVGGGFLMTPLLILIGVPPAIGVATQSNQIIASSLSGVLAHWRRGGVDFKMGFVLLIGGVIGSFLGVFVYGWLRRIGQIDLVISLSYVILLGVIGFLMTFESIGAILRRRRGSALHPKLHRHNWLQGLPFKMRFHKSRLYISALVPIATGFAVGILAAIMGVGGGFVMVPAMIYLLGMPTSVVIGTSLFQVIFVAMNVGFLQAWHNQTVDAVLALMLIIGGAVGAEFGSRLSVKLPGEQLRGLLAITVLLVAARLAYELVVPPADLYSIVAAGSGAG